jgi:hypothetical protein
VAASRLTAAGAPPASASPSRATPSWRARSCRGPPPASAARTGSTCPRRTRSCGQAPERQAGATPDEYRYDPEFAAAVAGGTLSPRQALERGSRRALIERLVERHRLPEDLATAVTDNRTSLLGAIRTHHERLLARPAAVLRGRTLRRRARFAAAVLALLGGCLWGRMLWTGQISRAREAQARSLSAALRAGGTPRPTATALPAATPGARAGTRWVADPDERLLEIHAPSADAVLAAFCAADLDRGFLEPVAVAEASPRHRALRFGIFRDARQANGLRAIRIRRDPQSSRWVAGDGRTPIDRLPLDRLAMAPPPGPPLR